MTPALRRGLLTVLVALALVASACTGSGGSTTSGPAGVLRLGLGGAIVVDPATANPAVPEQEMLLDLLHDGLTRVDAAGHVQYAVAKDWVADATFTTWRFTIDPAATFTSGRAVTAADVVGSLEHVIAAGDTSPAALRLEPVVGFRAYLDATAPGVAGLRAVDDRTVQITLDTPVSILPALLAAPAYGIVDLASLTAAGSGDLRGLDLSGSWAVKSAGPGQLILQHRAGAPGSLTGIEIRAYRDAADAYAELRKGKVDWAPIPTDDLGAARKAFGADHLTPFQTELALGLRVPGLPDLRLRQAIVAAVDRTAIVEAVYPDLADELRTIVPDGVVGHGDGRCTICAHDPAHARALLAEAYPTGAVPTVEIDFDASPAQGVLARMVALDLRAVGIPTTLRPLALVDYQHLLAAGTQQLFTLSWIGGDRTADAYLDPLFRSTSPDNLVALQSPDVDYLLGQARASGDPAVSTAAWAQAEQLILDQAVVIPIAQFRTQVAVAKRVRGLVHAVDGTVDWSAVRLRDAG